MKRIIVFYLSISLLVSVASSIARAQNWPSFRGPNASGVAEGKPTPVKWNAETGENILWKTPIPGLAHASPVIWDNRIFIATAIGSNSKPEFRHGYDNGDVTPAADLSKQAWKLYCLDKKTGKILWERTAYEGIPKTKRHPVATFANSTPATDGKHVVVLFGSEGLYCYDFNGKLKWKQDLGVLDAGWFYDPDYPFGAGSSPIIYKNLTIVQCDIQKGSFIAAFDLKSGKQVWRTARADIPSWGTPTIYNGKARVELITNATRAVRSYDPLTGKELWQLRGNPEITVPTPFVAHDLIYICNGWHPNQPIYAIKPGASGDISLQDGQESNEFVVWSKQRGGPYVGTPIVYGDYLYVCVQNGVLSMYEAKTGTRIYQQRLGDKGGAYTASPIAADGKIYFASEDGDIFVVKAGPKYELLSTNPMGEVLMATPAISDGMIIARGLSHVFAIAER